MTKDEALKLALEAFEGYVNVVVSVNDPNEWTPKVADAGEPARKAITAIKQALEQRTWVGLTDEEIEVIEALKAPPVHPDFIDCDDWMDFARAIEFKLKEKNELR